MPLKWSVVRLLKSPDRSCPAHASALGSLVPYSDAVCRTLPRGAMVTDGRSFLASGFGFRVLDFGLRASDFGFRVSGFGFRVSGDGLWVLVFRFRVLGFEFPVWCFGIRVTGVGFRSFTPTFAVASDAHSWNITLCSG